MVRSHDPGRTRGTARREYARLPGARLTEKQTNSASRKARPASDKSRVLLVCASARGVYAIRAKKAQAQSAREALRDDTDSGQTESGNRRLGVPRRFAALEFSRGRLWLARFRPGGPRPCVLRSPHLNPCGTQLERIHIVPDLYRLERPPEKARKAGIFRRC
jgi:hypothetical protein